MANEQDCHDAITDAYLALREVLRVGRVAFTHPYNVPFPWPLPKGIEVILQVHAKGTPYPVWVIEGDGLPTAFHGIALRTFESFEEMAKFVRLEGTPWGESARVTPSVLLQESS